MKFIATTGLLVLALSQLTSAVYLNEGIDEVQASDEFNFNSIVKSLGKRIASKVFANLGTGLGKILDGSGIGGTFGGRGHGSIEGKRGQGFGAGFAGNFRGRGAGNFKDILGGEIKGGGRGSGGLGFGKKYKEGLKVYEPKASDKPEDYKEGLEWVKGGEGGANGESAKDKKEVTSAKEDASEVYA
ncbi:hypothetical protein K493DRAFT_306016 [Basidiobolus meristosporus CBS 931.73]|uniref:Uncharacterized protein n=1 Tax=Basidiobolus meristosporus CBS 931.73 TaxID=1314790 RepID=A0A1Y1XTP4_9FUNG|nr:hypothetical protein K493DRAFT_306016 [Basidiobolus meristosporus CBS 931.73]|eukprot:ORX89139.1 hypothetical protein K493DRAFT_306016 [Basidiobolus meristosporus CBS 931.73]